MSFRQMVKIWNLVFGLSLISSAALAAPPATINDVVADLDLLWIVVASALVFFMQAGFALLESGMARAKNAINVLMKNYTDFCFGSIAFWAVGFGIMFGANATGLFGTDHFLMGAQFSNNNMILLIFQTMFAATAATIASGAMAERTRFGGYLLGSIFITAIIYPVFGSWAWGSFFGGEGWLKKLGFIDFAGATVVHSVGAWCAMGAITILGPRLGRFGIDGKPRNIPGHNLTLVAMGGFILWLGWFGFNGGSANLSEGIVGKVIFNTHIGGCAGAVGAVVCMLFDRGRIYLTKTINGSLGGLVALTAGCATMEPVWAVVTGFLAGIIAVRGERFVEWIQLDDVVGAISVHGFCGVWGTVATGMFYAGDLFNPGRIIVQFIGAGTAFVWAFFTSLVVYGVLHHTLGVLRADNLHQQRGLDSTEHYEVGYPEFQKEFSPHELAN